MRGFATTAGCQAFAYRPTADAVVVRRLLDAGALLLGKTNLDQFACGLSGSRSPWGAVSNAFNEAYVSGGSSSGSAYVVATGEVDFALGTDTAGSGRVPAGLNNIVGVKPSRGLISTRGVVPAVEGLDCVSIFARSVDLAARVLAVAVGLDPLDPDILAVGIGMAVVGVERRQERLLIAHRRIGREAEQRLGARVPVQHVSDEIEIPCADIRCLGGKP